MDVNFEDVAIAFSHEEWVLLNEAQRLLNCHVMLEVFALVSSVGWHKIDGDEACYYQSVSIQEESQVRASKKAPATQKILLCKVCYSVLKDILPHATYFEQKAFCTDACAGDFCFTANPHEQQWNECGEDPWKEAMYRASFVSRCSLSLSSVSSTKSEFGKDLHYNSELLQHEATLNPEELHCGSEISQGFLDGKSHHMWGEYKNSASHNLKVVQCQGVYFGELICECNKYRKVFRQSFNVICHKRVHTGEKPHECRHCGKFFDRKSTLEQHNKIHSGEKLYECSECEMSFHRRDHLTAHLRVHTGEKPYECTECGKTFSQKSPLTRHLRFHTAEKPYECIECGMAFPRRYTLTLHLKIHTGEKPYECRECGMAFRQRVHLTRHLRVHTGEKPYECRECGMAFPRRSTLTLHLRDHTGEKC